MISAKGGKAKQLTTEPGKYVEPTFSPDGELVVYRKTQGGHLTPRTWSQEPGLYKVDLKTKQNKKISAEGYQAQFRPQPIAYFYE